jgi:hypothetical protein
MEELVHYEVLARRPGAAMHLEAWLEDQSRALQMANEMIGCGEFIAVMVVRETRNPKSGKFTPLVIRREGDFTSPVTRKLASGDLPPPRCRTGADLYGPMARARIAEVLEAWLARKKITAFELIHRLDLSETLRNTGGEYQHAVQKFAVPEALLRRSTVHEVIKSLHPVIDEAATRLRLTTQANGFAALSLSTFAQVCDDLADVHDRLFLLGGAVAAYLESAEDWGAKVERVLNLADAAPEDGPGRDLAMHVLAMPMAEIFNINAAMADLLGPELDPAGHIAALAQLSAPDVADAVSAFDSVAATLLPKPTAIGERLARFLAEPRVNGLRLALGRKILGEIASPKRLRPASAEGEVEITRVLAITLMTAAEHLGGAEAVHEAFVSRSHAMVGTEFVTAYLKVARTPMDEALALARLMESVVGGIHKRQAVRWLQSCVTSLKFDAEIKSTKLPAQARLNQLAALYRRIARSGGKEAGIEPLLQIIGDLGGKIEADAKVLAQFRKTALPPVQKLQLLIRMAMGETAPIGPATERARLEAKRVMAQPETIHELSREPRMLHQVQTMMNALDRAA